MAAHLLVTGASGYIGTRLVELARRRGLAVTALGSPPACGGARAIAWRLGEVPPTDAFTGVTALLHLGHDWASDAREGAETSNINMGGGEMLATAALAAGVPRVVFASTTSARPDALNAYGRIKHAIEQRLRTIPDGVDRIVAARIGLVYGGPPRAMYGLMAKLAALPILPMIGLDRGVQPVHVDEVCEALLRLSLDPPAGRSTVVVAAARPVTFGAWLRTLRRGLHGRALVLVPVPIRLALLACDLTRLVPFVPTVGRERVLGLAGATPMDSAADLAALGLTLRDPEADLAWSPAGRRRLLAEAAAMLRHVSGRPVRAKAALARLARALHADPSSRHALPALAVRCPALLQLFEPQRPSMRHGLSRRLHLAAMVADALPDQDRRRPGLAAVAAQLALDIGAAPFRLLLQRMRA